MKPLISSRVLNARAFFLQRPRTVAETKEFSREMNRQARGAAPARLRGPYTSGGGSGSGSGFIYRTAEQQAIVDAELRRIEEANRVAATAKTTAPRSVARIDAAAVYRERARGAAAGAHHENEGSHNEQAPARARSFAQIARDVYNGGGGTAGVIGTSGRGGNR